MAIDNVVGSAYIIVHSLTDKINKDLQRGFKNADRDARRSGEGMGEAFTQGFKKVTKSSNAFTKFSAGIKSAVPGAEAARLQYTKLVRVSYTVGPAISVVVGGISSLVGGLGALVGSAGGAASSIVVLGSVFSAIKIGMASAKLALKGVSEALGLLGQTGGGGRAIDNTRQIEDAERRLARVIETNRDRLINANNAILRAQLALNDAFKAGREEIQQIGFGAENAALSQKRAGLELEKAREELARAQDLPPNSRIRREAELALEEAELRFRQAKDLSSDLNAEQDRLATSGVAGTNAVISATEQLAQAEVQRARVLRDGTRAQVDAERALESALESNNNIAGGGLNPFEGLNEYQVEFVKFLFALKPLYDELQLAASEAFLPPLQEAITIIVERAFPTILSGVSLVASAMGSASISVSLAVSDTENLRDTSRVFESSASVIRSLGRTLGNVWDSSLSILSSASQMSLDFVNFLDRKSAQFASFLNVRQATGQLESFFSRAGDIAADWGTIFGNIAGGFGKIIQANFGPGSGGDFLVQWLGDATEKFRNLDDLAGGSDELSEYFEGVAVNTQKILSSMGALITEIFKLGDNPSIGETFDILAEGAPAVGIIAEKFIEAAPAMAKFVENFVEFSELLTDTESAEIFLSTLAVALDVVNTLLENDFIMAIFLAVSQVGALALAVGTVQKISRFAFRAGAGSIGFFSKQMGATTTALGNLGAAIFGKGNKATVARGKFVGMAKSGGKLIGIAAVFAGVAGAIGSSTRQAQIADGAYQEFSASAMGVKSLDFNRIWEQQSITLKLFTGDADSASVSLDEMASKSYGANKAVAGFLGAFSGIIPELGRNAESYAKAEDTIRSFGAALGGVVDINLGQAQRAFKDFAAQTDGTDKTLIAHMKNMPELMAELKELAIANGLATDEASLLDLAMGRSRGSAKILAKQFNDTAAAVLDTTGKVQALADAVRGYTNQAISAEREAINYQESIDAVTTSLEFNGDEWDINTEAGRNNQTAVLDLIEATNEMTVANYENGGSTEELKADTEAHREQLRLMLDDFDLGVGGAEAYIAKLLLTPKQIEALVEAKGVPETKDDIQEIQDIADWYANKSYAPVVSATEGTGFGPWKKFWNLMRTRLWRWPWENENGGIMAYANGGMPIVSQSSAKQLYQFAEPETRWEALITGEKGNEAKNIEVWKEAGKRLGVTSTPNMMGSIYDSISGFLPQESNIADVTPQITNNNRTLNFTVTPSQGMDETELAKSISREIEFQLKRMEWEETYQR